MNAVSFGNYVLIDRISVGGTAEVFRAIDTLSEDDRVVAIKRLLPGLAEHQESRERFLREAQLGTSLKHPNIVAALESGRVGEHPFITLDYVSGITVKALFDRVRRRDELIPSWVVVWIISHVAEALSHVHSYKGEKGEKWNLVHHDLTPQNIFVSWAGEVLLADFGLAKWVKEDEEADKATASRIEGTYAYLSPEEANGQEVDARSDIFSLGVVLWELLTNRPLFAGENDYATLANVRRCEIPPPSLFRQDLPSALERITLRALSTERERRYPKAQGLALDLRAQLESYSPKPSALSAGHFFRGAFPDEYTSESQRLAKARLVAAAFSPRVESKLEEERKSSADEATSPGFFHERRASREAGRTSTKGVASVKGTRSKQDGGGRRFSSSFERDDSGEATVIARVPPGEAQAAFSSESSSFPDPSGLSEGSGLGTFRVPAGPSASAPEISKSPSLPSSSGRGSSASPTTPDASRSDAPKPGTSTTAFAPIIESPSESKVSSGKRQGVASVQQSGGGQAAGALWGGGSEPAAQDRSSFASSIRSKQSASAQVGSGATLENESAPQSSTPRQPTPTNVTRFIWDSPPGASSSAASDPEPPSPSSSRAAPRAQGARAQQEASPPPGTFQWPSAPASPSHEEQTPWPASGGQRRPATSPIPVPAVKAKTSTGRVIALGAVLLLVLLGSVGVIALNSGLIELPQLGAAQNARLNLVTYPPNAEVWVNGESAKTSAQGGAVEFPVRAGEQEVLAKAPGYQDLQRSVWVSGGERRDVQLQLWPLNPSLTVRTEPDARVLIDGISIGHGVVSTSDFPPGTYRLKVESECHHPAEETLHLGSENRELTVPLKPIRGRCVDRPRTLADSNGFLHITSNRIASVWIDGEDTGLMTPVLRHPLPPGEYKVRLEAGSSIREFDVSIALGRTSSKSIELP